MVDDLTRQVKYNRQTRRVLEKQIGWQARDHTGKINTYKNNQDVKIHYLFQTTVNKLTSIQCISIPNLYKQTRICN